MLSLLVQSYSYQSNIEFEKSLVVPSGLEKIGANVIFDGIRHISRTKWIEYSL